MRILRFMTRDGRTLLGDDHHDGTATVLIDSQGIFGPRQANQAAREMLRGVRTLVADDDEGIRLAVRKTLEKYDCQCTTCCDGAEALDAIGKFEFDLIVSDIVMPHHDGYEIFAASKEQSHVRPVVLITGFGYDPGHAVVKACEQGLEAVLYKPFTPGQLIEKVSDAIRSSRNGQTGALLRSTEDVGIGKILAPIAVGDVLCVGRNYRAAEAPEAEAPDDLELFLKPRSALLDPGRPIVLPDIGGADPQVACEGELAVVIKTAASNVEEAQALDCILGLTAANDLTARRWQGGVSQLAWMRGKGFDTFCPVGPALVTLDEVDLDRGLGIITRINGQVVRQGSTRQMIRPVARLISEISRHITLQPGTLLLTGAPPLVDPDAGNSDQLKPGDEVAIEIEGIGQLVNKVADR